MPPLKSAQSPEKSQATPIHIMVLGAVMKRIVAPGRTLGWRRRHTLTSSDKPPTARQIMRVRFALAWFIVAACGKASNDQPANAVRLDSSVAWTHLLRGSNRSGIRCQLHTPPYARRMCLTFKWDSVTWVSVLWHIRARLTTAHSPPQGVTKRLGEYPSQVIPSLRAHTADSGETLDAPRDCFPYKEVGRYWVADSSPAVHGMTAL